MSLMWGHDVEQAWGVRDQLVWCGGGSRGRRKREAREVLGRGDGRPRGASEGT